MASDYWRKRIEAEQRAKIERDATLADEMKRLYAYHFDALEKEIRAFTDRYGEKNNIPLTEVKKRVSEMDVKAFEEKAKKYVAEKDFSARANSELALYNLKMKVNRLELLQYQMDLELVALTEGEHRLTSRFLNDEYVKELKFQAGLLGKSVPSPNRLKQLAETTLNANFYGANWSDNIWKRQTELRSVTAELTEEYLLRGKNPTTLVSRLRREFDVTSYEARRLAITEGARVATEAQRQSYIDNDYDEYEYIAEPSACDLCKPLDSKIFKVKDMRPGLNAAPTHPHCRCSTAAHYSEDDEYERFIEKSLDSVEESAKTEYNRVRDYLSVDSEIERDLQKRADKIYRSMLNGESDAIKNYTGTYYGTINRYLRGALFEDDKDEYVLNNAKSLIPELERALNRGTLGRDLKLYRYVDYGEFYNLQEDGEYLTFLSTSISETATQHLNDSYKVVINAPKETRGVFIGDRSEVPEEREFLIQRGAKYRTIRVDNEKGVVEIELLD